MRALACLYHVLLFCILVVVLHAETTNNPPVIPGPVPAGSDFPPWKDPIVDRLGYRIQQAIEDWGAPTEVAVTRGAEAWQDSVVFYYADHTYLYWWGNRLWQLRFDSRYQGELLGVTMGLSKQEVQKRLGPAFYSADTELLYQLPDRGFPVRLRLIFSNDHLSDLYVYRSDF